MNGSNNDDKKTLYNDVLLLNICYTIWFKQEILHYMFYSFL